MDDTALIQSIARIRRAMPRNAEIMELMDELERRMVKMEPKKEKVSRSEYMRRYMRDRRKRERAGS